MESGPAAVVRRVIGRGAAPLSDVSKCVLYWRVCDCPVSWCVTSRERAQGVAATGFGCRATPRRATADRPSSGGPLFRRNEAGEWSRNPSRLGRGSLSYDHRPCGEGSGDFVCVRRGGYCSTTGGGV